MATANIDLDAEDGWVAVVTGGCDFVRIRSNTPGHAFFVTNAGSTPAATVIGYKVQCDDFWCDVPINDNVYVRTAENVPQQTRIDVFYVPGA